MEGAIHSERVFFLLPVIYGEHYRFTQKSVSSMSVHPLKEAEKCKHHNHSI